MRAIKIDVEKQEVYYIEIEKGLQPMYDAIGNGCDLIEAPLRFPKNDALFCDEEINFRQGDVKGGFLIKKMGYPITNNAIIVGADSYGESCDVKMTIQEAERLIVAWYVPRA